MAIELSGDITTPKPDGLIVAGFPIKTIAVELAAGTGTLKRGTVLAKTETGCIALNTANTGKPYAILCDDQTLSSSEKIVADAYEAGCFVKDKLSVADGYTLTDDDKEALREKGIFLEVSID